jgi:outer membrane protein, adhesin transport system
MKRIALVIAFLAIVQFMGLAQEPADFEIDMTKASKKAVEVEKVAPVESAVEEKNVELEEAAESAKEEVAKEGDVAVQKTDAGEQPKDTAVKTELEPGVEEPTAVDAVAAAPEGSEVPVQEEAVVEPFILTMEAAVESAMTNHPALSAARKAGQATKSLIGEAEGELYPSVDIRTAIGRDENENSTVINDGDHHRSQTPFEGSLLIRQNLFTGGRISNNIEKRTHAASEAFHSFLDERENTVFNAIDAYLEYCRNRRLITLAEKNVKVHETILATVEERKKQGMARDADVIQVKGRLALAKAQYQRELANKALTSEQFTEAIGGEPGKKMAEPMEMHKGLPKDLNSAKVLAMTEHPMLTARKHNIESAKAAAREADGSNYPQVAIELRGAENDNIGGTRGNDDGYSAMLVVNWNLFRGGADKAVKLSRLFEASQAEDLLLDERRKIVKNTAISWHDYKGVLVELNYFLQHEKAMKETLVAYEEQYKLNQRTLFDLLNAQHELFLASSRVIETKYAKIRGVYSIFGNMGNISHQFEAVVEE